MGLTVWRRAELLGTVVELTGEIDPASAPRVMAELRETITSMGPEVVLDFSGVTFMDSTGLHLLLAVKAWCEEAGGSLRLIAVHGEPARVLDICEFHRLIDFDRLTDVDAAPSALEATGTR